MRSFNEFLGEGKTFEIEDVMGMKVYVCTDKAGKEMFDPESGEVAKFNEKELHYSWKKYKNFFYSSENAAKKDLEESGLKAVITVVTIPSQARKFISESKQDDTYYAGLDIDNTEKIYQVAMRAKDGKSLEKSMMKMKAQFPDASKIDFAKVDWEEVYSSINEKAISEGFFGYDEDGIPVKGKYIPGTQGLGLSLDNGAWIGVNVDNGSPQGPGKGKLGFWYDDDSSSVPIKDLKLFAESLLKFIKEQ